MEHERYYLLMMDALDGELVDEGQTELEAHLRACPDCLQEWQALTAVDRLFRQAPMLMPAADFTQRTIARLPDRRLRIAALTAVYALLLLSGIVPILIGIWAFNRFSPLLTQPDLLESIVGSIERSLEVGRAVAAALFSGLGQVITQQPMIIGWLLVMIGVIAVWGGVYRQMIGNPREM